MTNIEAIKILQDTPIDVASTKQGILGLYAEALNMAIEALSNSQKQTDYELKTTTGAVSEADLISRQAAIDAISYSPVAYYPSDDGTEQDVLRADGVVKKAIRNLPAAHLVNDSQGFSQGDYISRQYAIEELRDVIVKDVQFGDELTDGYNDGIDMAITVISKLPSAQPDLSGYSDRLWKRAYDRGYERCKDDSIEAILGCTNFKTEHELRDYAKIHKLEQWWTGGIIYALDAIHAQPERKKGEWEEIAVIADVCDIRGVKTWASKMKCDQCGFTTIAIEGHFSQYNFCPNCGAKMRGDQDG